MALIFVLVDAIIIIILWQQKGFPGSIKPIQRISLMEDDSVWYCINDSELTTDKLLPVICAGLKV